MLGIAMKRLWLAALAAGLFGPAAYASPCPPTYFNGSGTISPSACGMIVYQGSGAGTLTLPASAWSGTIVDIGPGIATLQGPAGSQVNGSSSFAMVVGAGGVVSGDPSLFWYFAGGISSGGGGGVTWPTLSDIVISPGASGNPTGLAPTNNDLVYATGGAFANLATANSSVLVTSSGGVPSLSTTLPSGLTIPGFNASISWPTSGDLMLSNGGNAPTAYAGSACGSGQAVNGLTAGGAVSGCFTPTGSGTVNSGTAGYIAYYGSTGTAVSQLGIGNGLSTSGGNLNLSTPPNDQSSAGASIPTTDNSELVYIGAHTYTMPAAATAGNGWGTCFVNVGAGAATVNNSGDGATFKGAGGGTSLTIQANGWACPTSDGTNWGTPAYQAVTLPVASGGTGAATLTSHGILLGEGTGAVGGVGSGSTADSVPLWGGAGSDPTAAAVGSCSGASSALTYNTSTHAFGCNTISGGGGSIGTGYYTGANYYYLPLGLNNQVVGGAVSASTIYCSSGSTLNSITLEALAMDVTTIDATPGHAQLAVYDNTGTGHRPGSLLFSTASISEATLGMTSAAVTPGALAAGGYWFCINQDGGTAKYEALNNGSATNSIPSVFVGSATLADMAPSAPITGISTPETFGTWPSLAGATWTDITVARNPAVWVQAQ